MADKTNQKANKREERIVFTGNDRQLIEEIRANQRKLSKIRGFYMPEFQAIQLIRLSLLNYNTSLMEAIQAAKNE